MKESLDNAIIFLRNEIEKRQYEWQENPNYDGCYADGVRGMLDALNIISGKNWNFGKYGLTYSED